MYGQGQYQKEAKLMPLWGKHHNTQTKIPEKSAAGSCSAKAHQGSSSTYPTRSGAFPRHKAWRHWVHEADDTGILPGVGPLPTVTTLTPVGGCWDIDGEKVAPSKMYETLWNIVKYCEIMQIIRYNWDNGKILNTTCVFWANLTTVTETGWHRRQSSLEIHRVYLSSRRLARHCATSSLLSRHMIQHDSRPESASLKKPPNSCSYHVS